MKFKNYKLINFLIAFVVTFAVVSLSKIKKPQTSVYSPLTSCLSHQETFQKSLNKCIK